MRVAMLTGGGDCPGLNAVIRAVVRKGEQVYGDELVGLPRRLAGPDRGRPRAADVERRAGARCRGAARSWARPAPTPTSSTAAPSRCKATLAEHGIDALVAIGGEDTLGVAPGCAADGVAVVGVPKTIDNDLSATELTFGFDTAVQICVDAIDRLHTTAESHDRVMVVEVMGRHAGHIATWAAIAGGATECLIPERALRHRRGVHDAAAPPRGRPLRLDRRRRRGRHAQGGHAVGGVGRGRRLRPRPPGRHRRHAGQGHRGAHGLRDPGHRAGPRPAGRHAHRLRPGAGHPLRHRRHRRRPRRRLREDGGAPRRRHRAGAARRGAPPSSSSSTPRCSRWPRSSSADPT